MNEFSGELNKQNRTDTNEFNVGLETHSNWQVETRCKGISNEGIINSIFTRPSTNS